MYFSFLCAKQVSLTLTNNDLMSIKQKHICNYKTLRSYSNSLLISSHQCFVYTNIQNAIVNCVRVEYGLEKHIKCGAFLSLQPPSCGYACYQNQHLFRNLSLIPPSQMDLSRRIGDRFFRMLVRIHYLEREEYRISDQYAVSLRQIRITPRSTVIPEVTQSGRQNSTHALYISLTYHKRWNGKIVKIISLFNLVDRVVMRSVRCRVSTCMSSGS